MKSNKTLLFIIFIVAIVLIVVGIGFFANKAQAPSKLDNFAKALNSGGAKFYGAFWCTHCQKQKAEFGSSKEYLPYIECSNPDNTQTQICKDNKIESFPTWSFKDGISLVSKSSPIVCSALPGTVGESEICKSIASQYSKTWLFEEYKFTIKSPVDPVKSGDVWSFPTGSKATGEIPLEFLAQQIGYTLPK